MAQTDQPEILLRAINRKHLPGLVQLAPNGYDFELSMLLAAKDNARGEAPDALVGEVADLWFHCLVLLSQQGLSSREVTACLADRFGLSGLDEKAARARLNALLSQGLEG